MTDEIKYASATILISAALLFSIASINFFMAEIAIITMVCLKWSAIKKFNKKIDKFYFLSYLLCSIALLVFIVLQSSAT